MTWSCSHTAEGWDNVRHNLGRKPRRWLEVCLAEIQAEEEVGLEDMDCEAWQSRYCYALKRFRSRRYPVRKDAIVDAVFAFAEEQSLCTNGGFEVWCCPDGCHKVSFTREDG